jgi:hypothetical protein
MMNNQDQIERIAAFDILKAELEVVELEERLEMVSLMAATAATAQKPSNGCCCCNTA